MCDLKYSLLVIVSTTRQTNRPEIYSVSCRNSSCTSGKNWEWRSGTLVFSCHFIQISWIISSYFVFSFLSYDITTRYQCIYLRLSDSVVPLFFPFIWIVASKQSIRLSCTIRRRYDTKFVIYLYLLSDSLYLTQFHVDVVDLCTFDCFDLMILMKSCTSLLSNCYSWFLCECQCLDFWLRGFQCSRFSFRRSQDCQHVLPSLIYLDNSICKSFSCQQI